MLLVTVTVLTGVCILLPLWLTRDRVRLAGAGPLFVFFIAIGLGFMLIETSQMQRLIIALGHPTYGLSVVLFALLLSSGIGSYLTVRRRRRLGAGGRTSRVCSRSSSVLAAFGAVTPAVARWSRADDDAGADRGRRAAAVSGRADHGDGVSARDEARRRRGRAS